MDDPGLIASAEAVVDAYESVPVSEADRALVHTDVGFHNLGIDPSRTPYRASSTTRGRWADRHHDFRYLVFDLDRYELWMPLCRSTNPSWVTA